MRERAEENRLPRAHDFLQIDFEADHKEQENQPKLGDRADAFRGSDPAEAGRPQGKAADQISENDRLLKKLRDDAQCPSRHNAQRDVM
ncbi:MAG: hypothetical protein QM796_12705 [Chthoniobacteraceae bacterium]